MEVHLDEAGALATMAEEIRAGLTSSPKQLPSKYFYDERGSWLFEKITQLPEYYLTRAEHALLDRYAREIESRVQPREIVELGPGSAYKTRLLLEEGRRAGNLETYIPFDVSAAMLEHMARELTERYGWIKIQAVAGDFEQHLDRIPRGQGRLVALLGSTIGNFAHDEGVEFLTDIGRLLDGGGWFLLGTDLVKDRETLEAAYNDSQGVTAEFNKNVLNVINHQLDGDFDTDGFDHESFYNAGRSQIESYLRANRRQSVTVRDLDLAVTFDAGEAMRTEVSRKYTEASVREMLAAAGMELVEWLTDETERFALSLARRR